MLKERLSNLKLLNTRTKRIVALVLAAVLLVGAAYSLLRFGFGLDVLDRSGLQHKNGQVRYLDYFGRPQTGWQYIDGKLCYFGTDGIMATGWQEINGQRYYFDTDGVRATGWLTVDGKTYYLGDAGKVYTGSHKIDGKGYYFAADGVMSSGWQINNGKRSYFSQEGMALTGWQKIEGKLYYFNVDGYAVSGWQELSDVRYRFNEDGSVVTGWYEDETGKYYFDEDGHPHHGWIESEGERYYCNADGTLATGWLTLGQDRYFLYPDGKMAVGEVKIDGVSNFFSSQGKYVLLCNPWHPVPEDYVLQMSSIEGYQFASVGRDALQQMLTDCRAAGIGCVINNTYRSKATQQWMWDRSVNKFLAAGMTREEAEKETAKTTALPGHSEHQTGLGADLNGGQATYDWLAKHCWEYGFILRYPDNKLEITGIIYEPWHFRYVGTELALELQTLGITLEEYMAKLTPEEVPVVNTKPPVEEGTENTTETTPDNTTETTTENK